MININNTILLSILAFFLSGTMSVNAQQELLAYGNIGAPNYKQFNPANSLQKRMSLSLFNLNTSLDFKGPSLEHVGKINADGILIISPTDFEKKLGSENLINFNSYLQTVSFAFKIKGIEFDLGHSFRQQTHVVYPKDLVSLLLHGNGSFIGETMTLAPKVNMTSYHQFNLGISMDLGKLRLGTNLKLLNGVYNFSTHNNHLELHTSDDIYQLNLDANYIINTTGLFEIDDNFEVESNFDLLTEFSFFDSNFGFAIDIGATYEFNEKWQFAASIVDLGYINWTENVDNYTLNKKIAFEGLKLEDLINQQDGEKVTFKDTLSDFIDFNATQNEYKTSLSSNIYLSANYQKSDKMNIMAIFYSQQHEHFSSNTFAISTNYKFNKIFALGAIYAIKDGHFNNFGLSSNLNIGPVRLYIASDNILAFITPESARHINFRVGSALVF